VGRDRPQGSLRVVAVADLRGIPAGPTITKSFQAIWR
jgi:hypothetical protein